MTHGVMEQAVMSELSDRPAPLSSYFNCPSDNLDGMTGLADDSSGGGSDFSPGVIDVIATTNPNATIVEPFQIPSQSSPGDPSAYNDLMSSMYSNVNRVTPVSIPNSPVYGVSASAATPANQVTTTPNPYTYFSPPGTFMGPPNPPNALNMTPAQQQQAVIASLQAAANAIGPSPGAQNAIALQQATVATTPVQPGTSTFANIISGITKGLSPAAAAYVKMLSDQAAINGQPIHFPTPIVQKAASGNYSTYVVGGLVILGLIVAFTIYKAK